MSSYDHEKQKYRNPVHENNVNHQDLTKQPSGHRHLRQYDVRIMYHRHKTRFLIKTSHTQRCPNKITETVLSHM